MPPRRNQFAPRKVHHFGAINLSPGGKSVSPAQGAAQGAAAGSAFGPIGTGVGAAIGTVVGLLSSRPNTAAHIGGWDTQVAQSIGGMPASAAGIGRQIPWNENSHGLVQFIEALLATGVYMAWDPSILSNYDVCAHWATTFGAAVQAVTTAIVQNPAGQQVSVSISEQPGANVGPINFTFTNPGIQVGPDAIAAKIIMGTNGLMYSMITGLGETTAHASSNANNALAQKVYALMVDNVAAQLAPAAAQPTAPPPNVAPAVQAASQTVNATVAAAPPAPPVIQTPAPAPVMQAPPQIIEVQAPQAQSVPVPSGISTSTIVIIAALAFGAIMLSKK
jgi:hypothetical protein